MHAMRTILPWCLLLVAAAAGSLALLNGKFWVLYIMFGLAVSFLIYLARVCWIDSQLKMPYDRRYSWERFRVWRRLRRLKRDPATYTPELCREVFQRLNVPMTLLTKRGTLTVGYANWLLGVLTAIGGDAELVFGLGPNDCAFWVRYTRKGSLWRICCRENRFIIGVSTAILSDHGAEFDAYYTVSYENFCELLRASSQAQAS